MEKSAAPSGRRGGSGAAHHAPRLLPRPKTAVTLARVRSRVVATVAATALVALAASSAAAASNLFARDVTGLSLAVNAKGEALLTYTEESKLRRLLAWGAINARAPSVDLPQVMFELDYAGGWKKYRRPVWKSFRNRCRPYDGPALAFLVTACRAPDGSYWAVQAWQRLLPMRGLDPWLPAQGALEFHLSHWTGPLAELSVSPNWTYGEAWQGVFGRMLYAGSPVHGFTSRATDSGKAYGRYAYVDTYDSVWGPGWKRAAGKALHVGNGAFCYSFVADAPPPGYPSDAIRPAGNGTRHRVTVMGPGVTPDVQWEGQGLGAYDHAQDEVFNGLFDEWVGPGDQVCRNER